MQKILFLIISLVALLWFAQGTSAVGMCRFESTTCPEPPTVTIDLAGKMDELSTRARDNITRCLTARKERTESTIKDFSCPSGDFNSSDRPHTDEILSYQIGVATAFDMIDQEAVCQYARSLQCMRDHDPIKWQQTNEYYIRDTNKGYSGAYQKVCDVDFMLTLLNRSTQRQGQQIIDIIRTSDAFPQYSDCSALASSKVQALENLTTLLASKWVGQAFQNDKDTFMNQVKWRYKTLLDKVRDYMKTVEDAVKGMTKYITNPIQG